MAIGIGLARVAFRLFSRRSIRLEASGWRFDRQLRLGRGGSGITGGAGTEGTGGQGGTGGGGMSGLDGSDESSSMSAGQGTRSGPLGGGSAQSSADEIGSSQGGSESGTPQVGGGGQPPTGEGQSGQPQSGQASGGGAPGLDSGGEPGQAGPSSDAANSKAGDGLPSFAASSDDDSPTRATRSQSHRWGISSPQASIGFEHDATIYIEARRICVGNQQPIFCGRGESSDQLARAVLRAVDREARTWGRPRQNFYWVPSLKVAISPGGNLQYERIRPALERHGLSSTLDFRLEMTRPPALPRLVTQGS